MKKTNLTLEWIKKPNGNSKSLYVNGQKTNIYYFLPEYEHFNLSGDGYAKIAKAQNEEELIKAGLIYPENGDWTGFDTCASITIKMDKIEFLPATGSPSFWNRVCTVSGGGAIEPDKLKEKLKTESHWTQWTKMIDRNTGEFLTKLACTIYPNGYTIFFTK